MNDTRGSVLGYTVTPQITSQYLDLINGIITWKNYGRSKEITPVGKILKCDTKSRNKKDIVDIFKIWHRNITVRQKSCVFEIERQRSEKRSLYLTSWTKHWSP